ncbi:hypothetical protein H4V95_003203 [Arthrobacter sp. CAN_C5]|nr:hypothetical protein [Arthrobacter sp. CAN_C5]
MAHAVRLNSITVGTLLGRQLAAKADPGSSPNTISTDRHHARSVRDAFGDRVVSTLDTTEIEIWSRRRGLAALSRKKQVEIFRGAFKRGVQDRLIDADLTEGIVVSLGHVVVGPPLAVQRLCDS